MGILKLSNISKIKTNSVDGFSSRLDTEENRICELRDRPTLNIQTETLRDKRNKNEV